MIIAIDGPVASGKSVTARRIAKRLGALYFDTGLTYRGLAFAVLQHGIRPDNEGEVVALLDGLALEFVPVEGVIHILLDGQDITSQLSGSAVASASSWIAGYPQVRSYLLQRQRAVIGAQEAVVAGRDAGSVVFPDAALKIYLDATPDIRAKRRFHELKSHGSALTYAEVLDQIVQRDRLDTDRAHSPLRCLEDAIRMDTSELTEDQQVEHLYVLACEVRKSTSLGSA